MTSFPSKITLMQTILAPLAGLLFCGLAAQAQLKPLPPVKAFTPKVDTNRTVELKFNATSLDLVLQYYCSELTGRTLLQAPAVNATITLRSQSELTIPEAIQAIKTVLAMNNIALINQGEKFVKAVPIATAPAEGFLEQQRAKRLRGNDLTRATRAVEPGEGGQVGDIQLLSTTGASDLHRRVPASRAGSQSDTRSLGLYSPGVPNHYRAAAGRGVLARQPDPGRPLKRLDQTPGTARPKLCLRLQTAAARQRSRRPGKRRHSLASRSPQPKLMGC